MKLIFFCLIVLISENCFCQIIPLEKAIVLARKPFSDVSDYLTKAGWDYMGRDGTDTSKHEIRFVWVYGYIKKTNTAANSLFTLREVNTDTVFNIEEGISKDYYIKALNILPTLGFREDNTFSHTDYIEKIFWRKSTLVELMSSIQVDSDGKRKNSYSLIISRVMAD